MESIDLDLVLSSNYVIPVVAVLLCAVVVFVFGFKHTAAAEPSSELVETLENKRPKKTRKKQEKEKPVQKDNKPTKSDRNTVVKPKLSGAVQAKGRSEGGSGVSKTAKESGKKSSNHLSIKVLSGETENSSETDQDFTNGWTTCISRKGKKRRQQTDEQPGRSVVDTLVDTMLEEEPANISRQNEGIMAPKPARKGGKERERVASETKDDGTKLAMEHTVGVSEKKAPYIPGLDVSSNKGKHNAGSNSSSKKAKKEAAYKAGLDMEDKESLEVKPASKSASVVPAEIPTATPPKKSNKKKKTEEKLNERPNHGWQTIESQIADAMIEDGPKTVGAEDTASSDGSGGKPSSTGREEPPDELSSDEPSAETIIMAAPVVQTLSEASSQHSVKKTGGESSSRGADGSQKTKGTTDQAGEWLEAKPAKKKKKLRKDN